MLMREIVGTDFRYFLIAFDEDGAERAEADDSLMSETIRKHVTDDGVTDVFFTSHGCKGDIPSAFEQYDRWVATMAGLHVADQKTFWDQAAQSRKHLRVTGRTKSTHLTQALADAGTDDQILYFHCHAASTGLNDPGGPDASSLVLSDSAVMLGDLNLDSPTSIQLDGNPLVFINPYESGKMSPTFYDGFVPFFMANGARGVVGTECETPALFAAAWAKPLFERFLDGEALGDTFLGLRREFVDKHGNPLGLMYAVYCDGDTQIQPALKV